MDDEWGRPSAHAIRHFFVTFMPWQAGISRNNERYLPMLNGEPMPLAFEADVHQGWVRVYIEDDDGRLLVDGLGQLKTLKIHGRVELRKIPEEERKS